jgi:hypothetical protein
MKCLSAFRSRNMPWFQTPGWAMIGRGGAMPIGADRCGEACAFVPGPRSVLPRASCTAYLSACTEIRGAHLSRRAEIV